MEIFSMNEGVGIKMPGNFLAINSSFSICLKIGKILNFHL